jgi:hypothetical protein
MRSAPYHLIRMAIEVASEVGAFFSVIDFMILVYENKAELSSSLGNRSIAGSYMYRSWQLSLYR